MNIYELATLVIAELILFGYLLWRRWPWRSFLVLLFTAIPIYMATHAMTHFATIDEPYLLHEIINLPYSDELRFWFEYGAKLRTSDVIFGFLIKASDKFFPALTISEDYRLLKILSWLMGFVILLATHYVVDKNFITKKDRSYFFICFIWVALLLPTNDLAFSTFSYDKLTLSLSGLAVFCTIVGFRDRKPGYALLSVALAFLAAQEKPTAAPILLAAISSYAYLKTIYSHPTILTKISFRAIFKLLTNLLVGVGLTALLSGISILIVSWLRDWGDGSMLLYSIFDPLTAWLESLSAFAFGERMQTTANIFAFAITILTLATATATLAIGGSLISRLSTNWAARVTEASARLNIILTFVVIFVGLAGIYLVKAYVAPYAPFHPGQYIPPASSNVAGGVRHFGAFSAISHMAASVAYTYGTFIANIPSAIWLLYIGGLFIVVRKEGKACHTEPFVDLGYLAGILMPLAYGLLNMPFPVPYSARYLDIGVWLTAAILILTSCKRIEVLSVYQKIIVSGLFVVLFFVEILPFGPIYGAFRPIWLNPSPEAENTIAPGIATPFWGGWGEEVMLVAQQIYGECGETDMAADDLHSWIEQPCESIHLHSAFPGIWIRDDQYLLDTGVRVDTDLLQGETDYWIINRTGVILGWSQYPHGVSPILTLYSRGYPYAWVFRGDQLADAEFFGD